MAQNSIFSILLRSSWWISAAIALALIGAAAAVEHPSVSAVLLFAAVPFTVIAAIAAWKQRHRPARAKVEQTAAAVQTMSWSQFANTLEQAFRNDGCEVKRLNHSNADFELQRKNRIAIVSAKRWKASRVGVQTLLELTAVRETRNAHEAIYVTLGEVSEPAAQYAKANHIQFITVNELARLLPKR